MTGIRILYYSDAVTTGGAEAYLDTIRGAATDAGYAVEAAVARASGIDPWAADLAERGVTVHRLPVIRTLRDPRPFLAHVGFFVMHRYQLVHFNQVDPWSCAAGILAARISGLNRLISTSHLPNTVYDVAAPFRARAAPYCLRMTILVGRSHLPAGGPTGALRRRLRVVDNGIPLPCEVTEDARRALRRELGIPESSFVIGTVGRLTGQKNHRTLVEAAASVPEALFVVIGDGPERQALEALRDSLGLGDRFRFLGQRPDGGRLVGAFDVFAMPSLYEGLPLALLEAMGAGLPAVVSDLPETRDVIQPDRNGLLVPVRDAAALADVLRRLAASPETRVALGRAARERVSTAFSAERMKGETLALYREVLGEGRP